MIEMFCAIIPTVNEEKNLKILLPELKEMFPEIRLYIVDENSKDGTREVAKRFGAFVLRVYNVGFGRSLILGIEKAIGDGCVQILQLDADHPTEDLRVFKEYFDWKHPDLLVGVEIGSRFTRGTANWLARHFLGLDYTHPTCGLRIWGNCALKSMSWSKIKARGFSVQIETLFMAKTLSLNIDQFEFTGGEHKSLPVRRVLEWLGTLSRLTLRRCCGWLTRRLQ